MLVEALYFIRIGSFGNIDWLSTKRQLSIHIDILVLIKEQLLAYKVLCLVDFFNSFAASIVQANNSS